MKSAIKFITFIPIVLFAAIFIIFSLFSSFIFGILLRVKWWFKYGRIGKNFLIVYSNSPKWESYFQNEIIPLFNNNAVIVNISTDHNIAKTHIELVAHKEWAGYENHTPIVLYIPKFGIVKKVRFYSAFIEAKKTNIDSPIINKTEELKEMLNSLQLTHHSSGTPS